jgi:glycosyltransferase involved in cell wall biosynthesis
MAGTAEVARRPLAALVYADVDVGLIDGSAVWLTSTTELLARAGCTVTLQLKRRRDLDTPLLRPLANEPAIRILQPPRSSEAKLPNPAMYPSIAATVLRALISRESFDLVVVRGMRVATLLAGDPAFEGRLWTYLTDLPQSVVDLDAETLADLDTVARASRVFLCQTEDLRSYLESIVPAAVGRTAVLPPVVPAALDLAPAEATEAASDRPVRLAYMGKFAPMWRTLEMTTLPARLAERGVAAELLAIGDKVHTEHDDPTYRDRMQAALEETPGVIWYGGQSREAAMRLAATADIGLGWRSERLDASLELSTKVLEYGVCGLPVVLNRTPMHERLLGRDYPLFVSSAEDVVEAIVDVARDPSIGRRAAERLALVAADYTFERGTARLAAILDRTFPPPLRAGRAEPPLRIGVASHDLKFFTAILRYLESLPDVEVRVDRWPKLSAHDPAVSQALADWADVVVCEWFGPNAVWYSHHRRPGQRLIVRLHRFELDGSWPAAADIDQVDRVVCVSESYAGLTRSVTGWPSDKLVVIPNWVDDVALDRPKLDGARFNLGFIGMAPMRKRIDRALDVLEWLRASDPRYRLSVKSKLTWDYPWIWRRPEERAHVDEVMRRIQVSPTLRGSVVFDGFGPDVASWLRRVGFVLSTSDDESFHLAPAEGMASGAVPGILDWPGAATIYDTHWIHRSTDELARSIASTVAEDRWTTEAELAKAQARSSFAVADVCEAWGRLIAGVPAGGAGDATGGLAAVGVAGMPGNAPGDGSADDPGTDRVLPYGGS